MLLNCLLNMIIYCLGDEPVMMTFKAFLGTQNDSISGEEAIKKYAEYKLDHETNKPF